MRWVWHSVKGYSHTQDPQTVLTSINSSKVEDNLQRALFFLSVFLCVFPCTEHTKAHTNTHTKLMCAQEHASRGGVQTHTWERFWFKTNSPQRLSPFICWRLCDLDYPLTAAHSHTHTCAHTRAHTHTNLHTHRHALLRLNRVLIPGLWLKWRLLLLLRCNQHTKPTMWSLT